MSVSEEVESLSRRSFLRIAGLGSTAFCLGLYMSGEAKASIINETMSVAESAGTELAAWIGSLLITKAR